uniref:Uncharacterized protein n=1 Tax=Erpetoichthys calabaricus TaxID=27687 RepID=A0A8C4T601_ERPCA
VEPVTLAKTTALPACRGKTTHLSVLVNRFCNPLGIGIASDCLVEWVNENHFKKFVCRIFTHPVGVQYPQGSTMTTSTPLNKQK